MSDAITAGTAVRHKNGYLTGRVRHVNGNRAVCTWVRRHNRSWAYLANLAPITDAELIAHFNQQEDLHMAFIADEPWHEFGLTPPAPTTEENRRFLLGEAES